MVSESIIAEARRKALRNGEEDPVTVAQRYLNVYRQMHIFSLEKKDEFDQSLLNLQPIVISIIASLPGGLAFQDYIDEVLTKSGRAKSARSNENGDFSSEEQSQYNQAYTQQEGAAPVISGEAKLSMGKDFAKELSKIMNSIIVRQTIIQKDTLAKVVQDLGKTQLFLAKKLDDNKMQHQAEISELCKTIAQSHTALSTSLATLSENIANQKENSLIPVSSFDRSAEEDARLVEMLTQSQERMMSGFFARLPQAIGVGNVNVNVPNRSIEEDARLAEMIAQSQEKILAGLLEKIPQSIENITAAKNSENIEKIMAVMAQSQEKLISALADKHLQTPTQANLDISTAFDKTTDGDARLIEIITKSQEKLISSLIEKNILVTQNYTPTPVSDYDINSGITQDNNQYYYTPSEDNYSNISSINDYQDYSSSQETSGYSQDNVNFSMFTPVDEINNDFTTNYNTVETPATFKSDFEDYSAKYKNEEPPLQEVKKKKKKKKKKNNNNIRPEAEDIKDLPKVTDDGFDFLDGIKDKIADMNFDDIAIDDNTQNFSSDYDNNSEKENAWENTYKQDDIPQDVFEDINQMQEFDDTSSQESVDTEYIKQENNEEEDETTREENNIDDIESTLLFDESDGFRFGDSQEDDDDNEDINDKWLKFEDDNFSTVGNRDEDEDSLKTSEENAADLWGFSSNESDEQSYSKEKTDYVQENGDDVADYEWEYVQDDGSDTIDYEWEYVQDNGEDTTDYEWEYVEPIDNNTKIYSSDSFTQPKVPIIDKFNNNRVKIQISNIPQIQGETNDNEIDDPYKNNILKD